MREDYSTPRVVRWRKHKSGDHSECEPKYCKEAEQERIKHEAQMYDRALIDELLNRGLNPAEWWDRAGPYGMEPPYTYAEAMARLEGFDEEPDDAAHMQVRVNLKFAGLK